MKHKYNEDISRIFHVKCSVNFQEIFQGDSRRIHLYYNVVVKEQNVFVEIMDISFNDIMQLNSFHEEVVW